MLDHYQKKESQGAEKEKDSIHLGGQGKEKKNVTKKEGCPSDDMILTLRLTALLFSFISFFSSILLYHFRLNHFRLYHFLFHQFLL